MTPPAGLAWASLTTPLGVMSVGCSEAGLARVAFGAAPAGRGDEPPGPAPGDGAGGVAGQARAQLAEYFTGRRRRFDLPVDWSGVSGPRRQVLAALAAAAAFGETLTYGALARRAAAEGGGPALPARAIGAIMGSNPCPVITPCHRVVASDGLGGYSGRGGLATKRWLLVFEGALPATLDWDPAGVLVG